MNAPFRATADRAFETDRQYWRRLIGSFRHGSLKRPYGTVEYWAAEAALRLDDAEERRWCARMSESRPVLVDDTFDYDEELRRRDIAREIYHGGEMP